MVRFLITKIFILAFLIQVSQSKVKTYVCEVLEDVSLADARRIDGYDYFLKTNLCILKGLTQKSSDKHFQVVVNHDVQIDAVWIKNLNNKIETLTGDICEAFPNINVLIAHGVGLTSIDEDALRKCTKLHTVGLNDNSLTFLPPKIFDWNLELKAVGLQRNNLTKIDEYIFENNKKLTIIALQHNNFYFLPKNIFKNKPKLTLLWLHANKLSELSFLEGMAASKDLRNVDLSSNRLADIDIEKLHAIFPNLKKVNLKDNELMCERQLQIKKFLDTENIEYKGFGIFDTRCSSYTKEIWEEKKLLRECQLENIQGVKAKLVEENAGLKDEIESIKKAEQILIEEITRLKAEITLIKNGNQSLVDEITRLKAEIALIENAKQNIVENDINGHSSCDKIQKLEEENLDVVEIASQFMSKISSVLHKYATIIGQIMFGTSIFKVAQWYLKYRRTLSFNWPIIRQKIISWANTIYNILGWIIKFLKCVVEWIDYLREIVSGFLRFFRPS